MGLDRHSSIDANAMLMIVLMLMSVSNLKITQTTATNWKTESWENEVNNLTETER